MSELVRRLSKIKRPTKRLLLAGSSNPFSGFKIEDHLHRMETFEPLIFYDVFEKFQNGNRINVLYFRFVSADMYLLRGTTNNQYFGKASEVEDNARKRHIEEANERIKRQRRECIANIACCCILVQQCLPVSALNPNLHAWLCMIPYLMELCGHQKFEICIERLVSQHPCK
jgi:hypothetical protein